MKSQKIVLYMIVALSVLTLVACTNGSEENQNSVGETEQNQQVEKNLEETNDIDEENRADNEKENENLQEDNTTNTITKIEGRRQGFLEKLDNIQKELDSLPEKKDSDKGVTNAMKNYYGKSYEMYDKALNEIYALLKEELPPETMNDLQSKQIKWVEQKEDIAEKERLKYNGGTFENVAWYISLYDSTKEKCYELVNEYMTD